MELSWEEKAKVMVEWYKKVFENPPVLPLLIKLAALGNLKVNFHCAHWHSFFPLREGPPLISVFFNSLYDPFGSPCRGQKRRSEPFHSMVGGPSEVYASSRAAFFLCGINRLAEELLMGPHCWDCC